MCFVAKKFRNFRNTTCSGRSVRVRPIPKPCHMQTALQRSDLCKPRNETVRPHSQFPPFMYCDWVLYSNDRSTYFAAAKYADQPWEYINRLQKHEFRNWKNLFHYLEYLFQVYGTVSLQCGAATSARMCGSFWFRARIIYKPVLKDSGPSGF